MSDSEDDSDVPSDESGSEESEEGSGSEDSGSEASGSDDSGSGDDSDASDSDDDESTRAGAGLSSVGPGTQAGEAVASIRDAVEDSLARIHAIGARTQAVHRRLRAGFAAALARQPPPTAPVGAAAEEGTMRRWPVLVL